MINQLAQRLFANKFLLTAVCITTLIFVVVLLLSARPSSTPMLTKPEPTSNTPNPFAEFTNLSEEKLANATNYRALIADRLPIHMRNFKTSSGIETSIDITLHPSVSSLTRLDITGLSYLNKNELDPQKNANLIAFQETFVKALQLLRESGIEPKQLLFSYGEADYVRMTATEWVDKLGLLR